MDQSSEDITASDTAKVGNGCRHRFAEVWWSLVEGAVRAVTVVVADVGWEDQRRLEGWRGSRTWKTAHFTTARELRRLLERAGATRVETRYGLYLPPWQHSSFVGRAEIVERLGRPLRALGAGFVVAVAHPPDR